MQERRIFGGKEVNMEFVDLGLPSGLLWAKYNIGAESETDFGKYFAWGDITGYYPSDGHNFNATSYNATIVNGTYIKNLSGTLSSEYDAATQILGDGCRIPSADDRSELINYTTRSWTTVNGVTGLLLTSIMNGNTLFLPASGRIMGTSLSDTSNGVSWLNYAYSSSYAYRLRVNSRGFETDDRNSWCTRNHGFTIRAVKLGSGNNQQSTTTITINTNLDGASGIVTVDGMYAYSFSGRSSVINDISIGSSYTITFNPVTGYRRPSSISSTALYSGNVHTVNYTLVSDGVYIINANGDEIDISQGDYTCQAILFRHNGSEYAIYKDIVRYSAWGPNSVVNGIVCTTDLNTALLDMNGYENTNILTSYSESIANTCRSTRITYNGLTFYGYYPSLGEMNMFFTTYFSNQSDWSHILIDDAFTKIRENYHGSGGHTYSTSTQYSFNSCWEIMLGSTLRTEFKADCDGPLPVFKLN